MPNPPSNTRAVLEDLYQSHPELRTQEAELVPLIERLLTLRPKEQLSPAFKQALRTQLLEAQAKRHPSLIPSSFLQRMTSTFSLKQLALPLSAIALVAIFVTTLPSFQRNGTLVPVSSPSLFPPGSITKNGTSQAFGSLAAAFQAGDTRSATPMGGMNAVSNPGVSTDKRMASSLIAPPFDVTNYKYVYKGELPSWEANVDVYKRVKGSSQNAALAQSLAGTTQGLVNLGNMSNLGVQSFALSQSVPYGYTVQVDLMESMVTISQNYRAWPHPEASCKDEACFQRFRMKETDIPADAELIQIANTFLQTHGISTEGYADPQVNSDWKRVYAESSDKVNFYIPDILTVVYPLKVNGTVAYDEGGFPHGLMVNVLGRDKRVESVSNLMSTSFESSAYQTEQDQQRIRSVMEKGGVYGFSYPEAKKTVEVELQNPEIVLQKVWMPVQPGEISNELLIPALRFEVKNKPENSYLSNYILVPLVKEVLDQVQPGNLRTLM